jgi:hypothetical protein
MFGYTAQDRKLVVNEPEAAKVRTIFNEFLRLGGVHRLQEWLRETNIRSRSGNHFFRGPLYTILRNPHCPGLIKHKKDSYPGEHQAIIQRQTWDKVQALLDDNIQGKRRKPRATKESLLTGILFDAAGTRYTPTHANKNGRRYRYYTSQAAIKKAEQGSTPARIPAHDLETAVVDRILDWLQTPTELLAALRDETTQAAPQGLFAVINEILGADPSAAGLPPIVSLDCLSATFSKVVPCASSSATQILRPTPAVRLSSKPSLVPAAGMSRSQWGKPAALRKWPTCTACHRALSVCT